MYYACKMLTGQIKKGDDYGIFKKCISISVLDFILFDNEKYKSYYSSYHMTEDRDQRKFNDLLEFHIIELPKIPEDSMGVIFEMLSAFLYSLVAIIENVASGKLHPFKAVFYSFLLGWS